MTRIFFQKIEATNKIGFNKPFRTCICPKMGCHQKCHLNWEKHDVLILWDSGYHKSRILELRVHGNTELCQICGSGCVATLNPGRQPAGPGDQHFPTAFQPGYSYNSRCWVNAVLRSLLTAGPVALICHFDVAALGSSRVIVVATDAILFLHQRSKFIVCLIICPSHAAAIGLWHIDLLSNPLTAAPTSRRQISWVPFAQG